MTGDDIEADATLEYFEPDTKYFQYNHFLDMDGEAFTSWEQFYGPYAENGDLYTTPNRYNVSAIIN